MIGLLLGALLAASPAHADILFLKFNLAPAEITAAQAAARARGEKLRVYPEIPPEAEKKIGELYEKREAAQKIYAACAEKGTADCHAARDAYLALHRELDKLAKSYPRIDPTGLTQLLTEIATEKATLTSVVFSGHSGGMGSFVGLFGAVSIQEISAAFATQPQLLPSIRSILLWGCYGGTLYSLAGIWQKSFPATPIFAGYEQQAPLGIREASGRYLKSFLAAEPRLLAATTLAERHRLFRGVDLVAELDGAAVVRDSYVTYDSAASVSEMFARCDRFDTGLLEKFKCYDQAQPGCENPPSDHEGPLRTLYNFLQVNRHCERVLEQKYPGLPSPDYLVRLIFLGNVKQNFAHHYAAGIPVVDEQLRERAYPDALALSRAATSTRAENLAALAQTDGVQAAHGVRDGTVFQTPAWRSEVYLGKIFQAESTFVLGPREQYNSRCIPFSWVEPGASEDDACGTAKWFQSPLGADVEQDLVMLYFLGRRDGSDDADPGIYFDNHKTLAELQKMYLENIGARIAAEERAKDLSPVEKTRLAHWRQLRDRAATLQGTPLGDFFLAEIAGMQRVNERVALELQALPHNEEGLAASAETAEFLARTADIVKAAMGQP